MAILDELDLPADADESGRARVVIATLRALAPDFAARAARHDSDGTFPVDNFSALREANLLTLQVPADYGGRGLNAEQYCAAIAQLAAVDASTALAYNMHSSALVSIAVLGSCEQQARWFDRAVRSGAIFAALGSEPHLRPFVDGALPRTTLSRAGDGFVLDGLKSYGSFGENCDYLYVAARYGDRIAFALLDARSPNIVRRDDWNVMSMRATCSVTTEFKNVHVGCADVIVPDDHALTLLLETEFAMGYGPIYLAAACAAADCAAGDLVSSAATAGQKPDETPSPAAFALADEVGDIITTARPAWLSCLDAARTGTIGDLSRARAIILAKAVACDAACRIAERALRLRGGRALGIADPVGRAFRDVQAGQVMAFSPALARSMLGRVATGIEPPHITALIRSGRAGA